MQIWDGEIGVLFGYQEVRIYFTKQLIMEVWSFYHKFIRVYKNINMKKTNKIINKSIIVVVLISTLPILTISCRNLKGVVDILYPAPTENPVYFSSEAQTKNIFVENITGVYPENCKTEIVDINNTITETENCWIIIANDWLTIRYGQNDLPKRTVEITVKENTTDLRRFYNLEMSGFPGGNMATDMLIIVQEARYTNSVLTDTNK